MAIASGPANDEPRINDRIRAREVRLVGADGSQIGIRPLPEALSIAREAELDLVEVAAEANPPVCRIMDYGKYKYEASQRAKESRKRSTQVVIKEMKYRPKIGRGDFETKTKKVEKFLGEGHRVKLTIMFRGRETQHPELGQKILDEVANEVAHVGRIEIYPRLDGRNMTMVLIPDKKALAAAEKRRKASSGGSGESTGPASAESVSTEDGPTDTGPTDNGAADAAIVEVDATAPADATIPADEATAAEA